MVASLVEVTTGKLEGRYTSEGDVLMFRGIPYAAPPIGSARFRPPQPASPWPGVRNATRYGPSAPQNPGVMERLWGGQDLNVDEDCLTVNVWTPAADDGKRPVMVWIHGGAFMTGSGSTPWYDGRTFVRAGDVVVVTFNYRLGPFGFLHLADLGGEAYASSGNCGILDQVAALQWVHDNIAAFGGDPDLVTIFGESAGGMSVGTLLGMPSARGLFLRAIPQSGACANVSDRERATRIALETLAALGVSPDHVEALADVSTNVLLDAEAAVAARHASSGLPYQPVVDGLSISRPPLEAIDHGAASDVGLLCGTTLEEMRLFALMDQQLAGLDEAGLLARAAKVFGPTAEQAVATYRRDRAGAAPSEIWNAIATDAIFRIPAIRLLERQSRVNDDCWAYLFSLRSTAFDGVLGACHGLDVPFVFDNLSRPGVSVFTGDPPGAARLAPVMHQAWLSFARDGDPGHGSLPAWPRYEPGRRATMDFDQVCRVVDDPMGAERHLWDEISG